MWKTKRGEDFMFYYTLILRTLAECCMGEYTGMRDRKGNLSDQGHNEARVQTQVSLIPKLKLFLLFVLDI